MIRKYLVDKLTMSPHFGINMSFASRHGIETLTLHESSLELSVEETHAHNAGEEKIRHCAPDMLNHSTPILYLKTKHAGNLCAGFAAKGTGSTLDPVHAISDDTYDISCMKNHLPNNSSSYIVYANHDACGKGNSGWTDSGYLHYKREWKNPKIFSFITSIGKTFRTDFGNGLKTSDIKSSYATKNNEYGLVDNDLAMNPGTAFEDNVSVHGSVSKDTSLEAGMLKGQSLTFVPKNMMKRADGSGCASKNHVGSCHDIISLKNQGHLNCAGTVDYHYSI